MSRDMSDNDDDISDVSMPEESDDSDSDEELSRESENRTDRRRLSLTLDYTQVNSAGRNPIASMMFDNDTGEMQTSETQAGPDLPRSDPSPSPTVRIFAAGFDSLPLEVWQNIFVFDPPKTLGSLLRVNKGINALLDPDSPYPEPATPHKRTHLARRQPNDVWQLSRKRFRPRMPSPLEGMTELSMWRLACAIRCASCGKKAAPIASQDQWHCGPGENGFRPIWAFAESACGPCLKGQTVKEIDLLLSASVPSTLICALPFIFMTNELHVVASTALHPGQQPPSSLQISKYFPKTDVENIKKEYFRIKSLGDAAAEEWIKGLDDRGKGKRVDSARWERWEAAGGLQRIRKDEPDSLQEQPVRQTLPSSLPPRPATFHGYSGFGQPPHISNAYPPPPGVVTRTGPVTSNFVPRLPQRLDSPSLYGAYAPPSTQKAPRTKEEAEVLKLARRAEIERRCGELEPPISPSVLVHMPSFQASLHIIKPLDDTAWDMLKPRILSQRADAEQRENERLASIRVLQQAQAAPTPESVEREWEETQAIVKKRMGPYSDEIIRDGWGSGSKVTKETSPRFAAEVLIYVRKRFYAEIAKDDAAARIAGHPPLTDPPNGPFTRKLTMENMRWVFDTKIKVHTDKHRKEIFLCNACDTIRWYDFEGVCDHYASNHSGYATSGSMPVNWRAEWPEEPPFKPEPHLARRITRTPVQTYNLALTPAPTMGYPPPPGVSLAQDVSNAPAPSVYISHMPQPAHQSQFSDPYHLSAVSYVARGPYQPYQSAPPMQYSAGPSGSLYAPFYQPSAPELYSDPSMPLSQVSMPSHQAYFNSASTSLPQQATTLSMAETQGHIPPPVYRTEAYKAQLQDLALTAKALWTETAGVKDMPGSVRVYVILFHVLQRLRERYTEDPPFSMFVDGIQNAKEMRVVRNVNGLACRTCKRQKANKPEKPVNPFTMSSKTTATPERKLYSLPQLVNHFQSEHSGEEAEASGLDWRNDMVELPEKKKIQSLEHAAEMDDHKLYLLREALPEAFKPDTPTVNNRDLAPSMDKHDLYYVPAKKPSPEVDMRRLLNPEMDKYPRLDRRGAHPAAAAPSRPARDPSPEVDMTKLYNSAVDNYPHTYNRGRPSGGVAPYGGSQTHSAKRKATSPLGGRLGPVPTENGRYLEANVDVLEGKEQEDVDHCRPAHTPQSYLTRPEYNHHDVDLSRLLANAGHVSRPAQPQARHEESDRVTLQHPNAVAATKAAEQFLASMGGRSWETMMGSQNKPADAPAVENREGADPPRPQYISSAVSENYRRQSPDEDRLRRRHGQGLPANPTGQGYIHEEARFVEYRPAHSQAPSREIRYSQPEVIRFSDETRASGSPVYVMEEPPRRRQYRAVSPGGQRYVDEQYEQRQEYYEYADEQPRPRQVLYEPEIEYIRVRDPGGDYLVEKPRQQPIYTRYEDSEVCRQPMYEDGRMRPVYEDEHIPMRLSQGSQRPRQIVYVDEARTGAVRFEEEEPVRYAERQQSVVVRLDGNGAPIQYEEQPRSRQQLMYEEEPERRQLLQERNSVNPMATAVLMSKNDPAYYEEYDPSNPTPLPVVPRRVHRHE